MQSLREVWPVSGLDEGINQISAGVALHRKVAAPLDQAHADRKWLVKVSAPERALAPEDATSGSHVGRTKVEAFAGVELLQADVG